MICTQCGFNNEQGEFCGQCGAPLSAPASGNGETNEPNVHIHDAHSNEMNRDSELDGASGVTGAIGTNAPTRNNVESGNTSSVNENAAAFTAATSSTHNATTENQFKESVSNGWNKIKDSDAYKQSISISKQYGSYFIQTLKSPSKAVEQVTSVHVINAIISIALTALIMPLIPYFILSHSPFGSPSFLNFVIKPFIYLLVAFILSTGITFGILRLAQIKRDYLTLVSKIGVLFVPAIGAFLLGAVFALLDFSYSITMFFLLIGLSTVIIAHIYPLLTARKEQESVGKFDLIYGAIFTVLFLLYVLTKAFQFGASSIVGNLF
jgi:hypothetical protein